MTSRYGVSKSPNSINRYDPRIAQLRFFAALSVAFYHLWTLQIVPLAFFRPGWLGVPLFFELSIFLLLNRLDANPSLPHYFKRRIMRIWPLYFLAVIAVFLVDKYVLNMNVTYYDLALHFVFVSFVLAPFSFQYLFWTLQLEEWMYVAIPFIHRLDNKRKLQAAVSLILVSVIYSLLIVSLPYNEFHLLYFMPPFWLGAYGWGIIAYLLRKRRTNMHYIGLALLYGLYIFVALYMRHNEFAYEFLTRVIIYNLTLPMFALLILNPPSVSSRATVFLGEVSYGFYLWTLLFQELFGAIGIVYGILAAIVTEFPLRKREIISRLKTSA
jgi:peptidoglycan/LPS O-acetylase OafA/YrhL